MKKTGLILLVLVGLPVLGIGFFVAKQAAWFVGESVQVAKEEFGPRRLLEKYEWFKNQAAALDSKQAMSHYRLVRERHGHGRIK